MDISVMVEQLNDEAFRASVVAPTPLVAEASTRNEAIERIRKMILDKLSVVEVIQVAVPVKARDGDPWEAVIGTWAGHPDRNEFEQNVRDYRHEVDSDAGRL